jgi:VanZ family protein
MNNGLQKLKMRLPAIILLAATLLFWGFYDRYESAGPVLLESPSLTDATRLHGNCAETNGLFTLRIPAGGKPASINFRMPKAMDYQYIRVHARMRVENVVEGKFPWRCARLLLTQYDETDKWIPGHHGVVAESGTKDWSAYEDIFKIVPEAVHADLIIQQVGLSGSAWFDSIEAQPLKLRASFPWWRSIFFCLWIFTGVLYFPRCRLHRRRLRLLILLNVLAILAGTLMPHKWIEGTTGHLKEAAIQVVEKARLSKVGPPVVESAKKQSEISERETRRIDHFNQIIGESHRTGHFMLFASLCFLVYCSAELERQHAIYFFKVAFDILLFAAITESLQHLTLDRTAGLSDLLTDVYGMVAALLLFLCVRPLFCRQCR